MIADLKPYPAYKDSGVEWLGDVPEHWQMVPNRALMRLKKELVGSKSAEYLLLSLTKRGVVARDMENPEGKFPAQFDSYQVIEPGDLIFCLFDIDETPRAVGLSSLHGMITGAYTRVVCADETARRFAYLLYMALDNGKHLKPLYTGLRKVITKSTFLSAKMPLPSPPEQAAIVRFLDHADRRIRRYIRAKQKLITLLEEQKQAIIHQAVTGQVDVRTGQPYPAYKDSSVEWLGDVPEHWQMVPNRALMRLKKELVGSKSVEYLLLSLTKRGVVARDMENPEGKFPAQFDSYQVIEPGDLIFCLFDIDETPRAVGLSSLHGMITGAYTRVVCADETARRFAYLLYMALDNGKHLKPLYTGLRKVITKSTFLSAKMPLPSPPEQAAIIRFLDEAAANIDDTINRTRRQIELLSEYRTRLIADVVTGKLDVRKAAARLADEVEESEPLDEIDALINGDEEPAADLDTTPEEATV